MGPLYGDKRQQRGRMIFRAWAEDQGQAAAAVNLAINTAVTKFNATNTADSYGLAT
jgi:hypothetical protein